MRIRRAVFLSLTSCLACESSAEPTPSTAADRASSVPASKDREGHGQDESKTTTVPEDHRSKDVVRASSRASAAGPDVEGVEAPVAAPEVPAPEGSAGDDEKLPPEASAFPVSMPEWTGRGPFAHVKFAKGPMVFDPVRTAYGKLPHEPTKHHEPDLGSPMGHTTKFGWSADNKTFTHCADMAADCQTCITVHLDGQREQGQICETKNEATRWRDRGFAPGPTEWKYGDLVLAWTESRLDPETVLLEVAAKTVQGPTPPSRKRVRFSLGAEEPGEALPEAIALSHDGQTLAIIGHAFAGEGSDEFEVKLVSTGWLAAEAYNAAGLEKLQDQKYVEAADLFIKASVANPEEWKGPFNAACAYGRADDRRVQAALTEAIRRGGDAVKSKAKRDPDLESVRKAGWFSTLVGA
jgi:hypothetical protein